MVSRGLKRLEGEDNFRILHGIEMELKHTLIHFVLQLRPNTGQQATPVAIVYGETGQPLAIDQHLNQFVVEFCHENVLKLDRAQIVAILGEQHQNGLIQIVMKQRVEFLACQREGRERWTRREDEIDQAKLFNANQRFLRVQGEGAQLGVPRGRR